MEREKERQSDCVREGMYYVHRYNLHYTESVPI